MKLLPDMTNPLPKLLLALLLGLGSSTFAQAAAPHTKVYLLRGFMNIFSLGMDQLASELQQRGISAEVYNHMSAGLVSNEAIQACKSGQVSSIVLVGHSLGASAAVSVAQDLSAAGVKVALVITLDPVVRTVVPANVQQLKNLYISNGWGATVERSERFHGSLQNVDLKNDPSVGHVSMATSPAIHKQMLQYIMASRNSHC